ncbi:MAG: hypothetical protein ACRC5A_14595, partial [Enterobacteriaceae bacterium]
VLSWQEIKQLIRSKVTLEHFEQICTPCCWKPYGACVRGLNRLLSSPAAPTEPTLAPLQGQSEEL